MADRVKLFGAALDVLDDPERIAMKRAWVLAMANGMVGPGEPKDPYDALAEVLARTIPDLGMAGKLDLPGCLTPRPPPEDLNAVIPEIYRYFDDTHMGWTMMRECRRFVENNIFPAVPGMISVDHSMTAGTYSACCRRYGYKNVTLIVLDSHFDAIATDLRAPAEMSGASFPERDTLHCGNFIERLIEGKDNLLNSISGTLPENIIVIGTSDYPPEESDEDNNSLRKFRAEYLSFIKRGVTVFSKSRVRKPSFPEEFNVLLDSINTPYIYVSLDADVGSCACMNAVRFMDTVGLDEDIIIGMARAISERMQSGRLKLAGFDVAEIDIHLLGLEGPDGAPDRTAEVCARFVKTLLGCEA